MGPDHLGKRNANSKVPAEKSIFSKIIDNFSICFIIKSQIFLCVTFHGKKGETMKNIRCITTLLLAAAIIPLLLAVPAQAKKKKVTYWQRTGHTTSYYRDGKWEKEYKWSEKYNNKGKITSDTSTSYHAWDEKTGAMTDKKEVTKTVYKYKKGKITKATTYTNDKKTGYSVYSYNKKGYLKTIKHYNKKGKKVSTTTYKYNTNGTRKSETIKYTNKKLKTEKTTFTYKYYSGKRIKKRTSKRSDGTKTVFDYAKNGNMTKYTYTGTNFTRQEFYNKKGLLEKETHKSKDSSSTTTYTYNNKDLKTKSVEKWTNKYNGTTNKGTTTYTYECKADTHGNVIEEIEYRDGKEPSTKYEYTYKKLYYYE